MRQLLLSVFLIANTILVSGQTSDKDLSATYALNNERSSMEVNGTSTLHDWTVEIESHSGKISYDLSNDNLIKSLEIAVVSESLKSGKSGMDKNTYKALKTDEFRVITFVLTNIKELNKLSDSNYRVICSGNLTVVGAKRPIDLNLDLQLTDGQLVLSGEKDLLMTDFGIEPPTALLGTIKTGNEINIKFKSVFNN